MLAYVLAIVIAIGSFSFYITAFFVPEMHRRQDFFWSGLGMFYAVVLWFCAGRITGAVLLGQTASVVLLGWLGWHTLELRRELTPEPVRTPVTWQDLQQWSQTLQSQVSRYVKFGALTSGLRSAWSDLTGTIADLQKRTAGPRGVDGVDGVPPLQRSPAYEFETTVGEGETVPSEFASVATRTRLTPEAAPTPPGTSPAATADGVTDVTAEDSEQKDDLAKAATPPPSLSAAEPTEPAIAPSDIKDDVSVGDSKSQTPVEPVAKAETMPVPQQDSAAPKPPKPTAGKKAPVTPTAIPTPRPAATKANPVTGFVGWLEDVAKGFRKPKPERTVIEIPPRAPSIPRSPTAATGEDAEATPTPRRSSRPGKPQRAVIDIPPRPPSIPRPDKDKSAEPPPAASVAPAAPPAPAVSAPDTNWDDDSETNWDDTAAVDSDITAASEVSPDVPPSISSTDPLPQPLTTTLRTTDWEDDWDIEPTGRSRPQAEATKEETPPVPSAETNVVAPSAPIPAPSNADETNWPDDEDSNWPD